MFSFSTGREPTAQSAGDPHANVIEQANPADFACFKHPSAETDQRTKHPLLGQVEIARHLVARLQRVGGETSVY
jgi:hypothetical protein